MRIAYFDCFAGISGEMMLGALLSAGLSPDALKAMLSALTAGDYSLNIETVTRAGLGATRFQVLTRATPGGRAGHAPHANGKPNGNGNGSANGAYAPGRTNGHSYHPPVPDIERIVMDSTLPNVIKNTTLAVLNVLVNFFRPIPFVIFIAAVQPFARVVVGTGIGNPAIIFALTLAAAFGISRIVEQNLVTVDPGVIEAARSVGAGRARIVRTVVLPEALGPLVLGYTFAFVALVDMTAVAGVIGGGGLGNFALQYGFRQFDTVVTWTAVIAIVVLVQVVQLAGNSAARRILRR